MGIDLSKGITFASPESQFARTVSRFARIVSSVVLCNFD